MSVAEVVKPVDFRGFVGDLLAESPALSTRKVLILARKSGHGGRQSLLHDMVAEIRAEMGIPSTLEALAAARSVREARKAERRASRAAARESKRAHKARSFGQRREARLAARGKLGLELFRPLAQDEESNYLRVHVRKWIDSREATHKTCGDDRSRWRVNLAQTFGALEPGEVDVARIRAFVEERLASGLSSTTVRNCILLLSSLFTDLVERGLVPRNPVKSVPRAVKRLYRRAHDPRTTPFIESAEGIQRLRAELATVSGPLHALYSVAVKSGVRPGELVALHWEDIRADRIHVQRRWRLGKVDTPKSGKGRVVPISPELGAFLGEMRERSGGRGVVFKPVGRSTLPYIDLGIYRETWHKAVARAGLKPLSFYRATRHTFASHWVMAGRPIEQLSAILGHSSVMVTEVYAHLKPENLTVPDVFSFDRRVEDPKGPAAADGRLLAELADARGQIARLTDLLAQQGQALSQLAAVSKASTQGGSL